MSTIDEYYHIDSVIRRKKMPIGWNILLILCRLLSFIALIFIFLNNMRESGLEFNWCEALCVNRLQSFHFVYHIYAQNSHFCDFSCFSIQYFFFPPGFPFTISHYINLCASCSSFFWCPSSPLQIRHKQHFKKLINCKTRSF